MTRAMTQDRRRFLATAAATIAGLELAMSSSTKPLLHGMTAPTGELPVYGRHHHFGEGEYEPSERVIQQLLTEAGTQSVSRELVSVDAGGVEAAADWGSLASPENYLGSERSENFAGRADGVPTRLRLNQWALSGDWTVDRGAILLNKANGRIVYRFHARDLHLVMGPAARGASVRFRVLIDGQAPGAAHGIDVDEQGNGTATKQRLYQLIRQPKPIADRQFEIEFVDAGVGAFAFTFG